MAPSRRKGAGKVAAIAVSRREWNVGDLVLAKVKGFPAWPATVSKPEKWGYPVDRKKVLVHFFGTQQIGFCNPVDVEEFTEERKISLLGKRHGKGADFVHAVNEIIACFEKLKRQDQVCDADAPEEISANTTNNSGEFVKDEAPVIRVIPPDTRATNDLKSLTDAAVAAVAEDALLDEDMQSHSNLVFRETPEHTIYSPRSKADVSQSQNSVVQRTVSARRLRSSTRIYTNGLHSLKSPAIIKTRLSRRSSATAIYDRSLRRSTRSKNLSDDSEGTDTDSVAFVSSQSIGQHSSEDATEDSDMSSLNDASTVESHCKPMVVDYFSVNNYREIELGGRINFQTSTPIVKKKRRHNKKRPSDENIVTDKLNLLVSEAEILRTECVSLGNNEKSAERFSREDGDEHLPLVKRARVRMGRPSSSRKEEGVMVQIEDKLVEVPESLPMQVSGPLNCNVDNPGDCESVPIEGGPINLPLSPAENPQSPESGKNSLEIEKSFVDGEAALPPTKRLNRALEAMSANVAEDSEKASKCLLKAYPPKSENSADWSELSVENEPVMELMSAAEKNLKGYSDSGVSEFCAGLIIKMPQIDPKVSVLQLDCVKICGINSSNSEPCKDFTEDIEGSVSKCFKMSTLTTPSSELDTRHQQVKPDLPENGEGVVHLDGNRPHLVMSSTDHCKIECVDFNEAVKGFCPGVCLKNSECFSLEDLLGSSCNRDISVQIGDADVKGDETQRMKYISLAESIQGGQRSEAVKEVIPVIEDSSHIPSASPVKVLTASPPHRPPHLSNFNSISDDHLDDITVSVTRSFSSLVDGPESVASGSPLSSSTGNISASAKNCLDNNGYGSSDIQLHSQKANLVGKSSSKRETLSSFEAIIRSLTGTKESIGRATRVAIDSAKSGLATKVMEILAQNLERESSSHKKVDLFFLVDSITQCSRGLKGDGGIYPSVIQALLPRLLLAAAPSGSISLENHRQCLKVLRVWQERKIIPEAIIRRHIRELDAHCNSHLAISSHRPLRNERAFDDPVREMEGMLVDEYGSNASFQLPGFCMPPMLRDDDGGSDSDEESFEAVTPEHNAENLNGEKTVIPSVEKHSHILEDVDGELEMEDVAPFGEVEIIPTNIPVRDYMQEHQSFNNHVAPFTSHQPNDVPLMHAPVIRSHPSPPPPLPPSGFPCVKLDSSSTGPSSNLYLTSQNSHSNLPGSMMKHSVLSRIKQTPLDLVHHRSNNNRDFEALVPRRLPDSTFSKGLHLRPPQPSPSNQFSYAQERIQSSRDILPPPSHLNRFPMRNEENGNFYIDRDRNKFVPRDNIGERWRPPLPSISGPYHRNSSRMAHAPRSFSGPPCDPSLADTRWNYPPRSMNHRHFNPHRSPEGPIPVGNRGPNSWKPR